jgi:IclR family pca regulon transcriptional regulator
MASYENKSLNRGLAILSAYQSGQFEFSLPQLAKVADVTPSSALRIAYTLVQTDFLVKNPISKGYRLGPKSMGLSHYSRGISLPDLLDPFLAELRNQTNETIKLAYLDGSEIVVVARHLSREHSPSNTVVGNRIPAYCSSLGRALLSMKTDDEVIKILEQTTYNSLTPKTLVDREAVLQAVRHARLVGYAINDQQTSLIHRAIAAGIRDCSGHPIGAINISVAVDRMSVEELELQYGPVLKRFASFAGSLIPNGFGGTSIR